MEIKRFVIELRKRPDGQYEARRWDVDEQGVQTLVSITLLTAEQVVRMVSAAAGDEN